MSLSTAQRNRVSGYQFSASSPLRAGVDPALSGLQESLGIEEAKNLDDLGQQSRPARLVAYTEPRPIVAVELLVKEDVIPPVRTV